MYYILLKYAITAGVVVLISELAKRSDKIGGAMAALPTITILTLIWLYIENQSAEKIQNHAWYTFWYVLPTLPMFLIFPFLFSKIGFWATLLVCCIVTIAFFAILAYILRYFGIYLI